ncbi:MAG: polyketide synthase [Caldilineaceae bacterium]
MSQLPSAQELLAALQQSTRVIQSLENRLNRYHEPIAIIGIGCRFPGRPGAPAHTPEAYWANLRNGADAVSEVIGERWPIEEYYDPDPAKAGKTYTRYGAFIDQVDQFDPRFFGLSPRETIKLDPQHRLLLETAWEAIERAGIAADRLRNTPVGVFVGLWTGEYGKPLISAMDDFYSIIGNVTSTAAGRLSYLLGLTGPALAVDTACSASLVSIHLACQSLRHGECKMALAGGVNLILAPEVTALFCRGSLLAPDGRCKTFDAAANGYVRGEGCGMILLKPLTDALTDNDPIIAVIRGTAINQDGPSSGLTVPNGPSQEGVIRQALKNARVKPEDVSYIEAHGTGTALGDPIEIGALTAVFQERTTPLHVGSVKTNFGHLEFAAGIAGVIKVALALQHGEIPKHLHFDRPNPLIDWDQTPIQIPTETIPWTVPAGKKRLAGVSSFGFSGTNAHIVLEEAPVAATRLQPTVPYQLLTLSAKDEPALHAGPTLCRRSSGFTP